MEPNTHRTRGRTTLRTVRLVSLKLAQLSHGDSLEAITGEQVIPAPGGNMPGRAIKQDWADYKWWICESNSVKFRYTHYMKLDLTPQHTSLVVKFLHKLHGISCCGLRGHEVLKHSKFT